MVFMHWTRYFSLMRLVIARPIAFRLGCTCAIILATTAFASVSPLFLQDLVNGLLHQHSSLQTLLILLSLYLASNFFSRIASDIRWTVYGVTEQEIKVKLNALFFNHIFRMPHSFFLERNAGEISQIMTTACEANRSLMINLFFVLLPTLVEFASAAIILLYFGDHLILLAISLYTFVYLSTSARYITSLTHVNQSANTETRRSASLLGDAMINFEAIKCFDAFGIIQARYVDSISHIKRLWSDFYHKKIFVGILQGTAFVLTLGGCLIYALIQVRQGHMLIGHFILINAYIFQVCRPLESTVMSIRDVRQGLAQMAPYVDIIQMTPALLERKGEMPQEKQPSSESIRFADVSFSYPGGRKALDAVSFSVPHGKITAVVGPTGSGKSTIVKILLGLYLPEHGRVTVAHQELVSGNESHIREHLSIVPQDVYLFNDTIAFNIGIGKPGCPLDAIKDAAKKARIDTLIDSLPEKYDTLIGNQGLKLSGGERQRIAIARALLKDPEILIFDEATSSLDVFTEDQIIQELLSATQGKTLLLVAHRFSSIKLAHHIIVMQQGRVSETGSHAQLMKNKGWYYEMYTNYQKQGAHLEGTQV